jgi:hypothetical protein
MSYELRTADFNTVIFTASTYDDMFNQLGEFKEAQLDKNIDGLIIRNTITKEWDYAWKVAINHRELKVS